MIKRLREKLKERKGFTLLEMMIVLAVIAILTGLVSAGIYGYLTSAYMIRVNDTAKTVFLAAQNYLTEQKQLGRLEEFNRKAEACGDSLTEEDLKEILLKNDSSFDFDAYKAKYRTNTVRWISLSEGDGVTASENPIYTIVKNYLNDEDLLAHTFLMEYDTTTGVVRSVFYTEKAADLSYTGELTDKSNVVLRDRKTLRNKQQGYYGVTSTSLQKTDVDIFAPKQVSLINGERLYAQWQESNFLSPEERRNGYLVNANDAFDEEELRKFLVFDVSVYRIEGETEELLFTVSDLKPEMAKGTTLAEADAAAGEGIRLVYNSDTNVYQLLLDDIDHSIYQTYGEGATDASVTVAKQVEAEDMLICRVSERLSGHDRYEGNSDAVSTNVQSANFAGGADEYSYTGLEADKITVYGNGNLQEDGSEALYGKAFSIANARHLNNMRYAKGISCFIQTADIDWAKPEIDRPAVTTYFEPLKFREDTEMAARGGIVTEGEFSGTFLNGYKSGDDFVISHLNMEKLFGESPQKHVGMFRQNAGTIDGIHIKDSNIKGAFLTGIVCGSNSGEIVGAVIENSCVIGAYYIGGVTGYNHSPGEITDCQIEAEVHTVLSADTEIQKLALDGDETPDYGWYAGGVAGVNKGKVAEIITKKGTVTGICNIGGLVGMNGMSSTGMAEVTGIIETSTNRNRTYCLKDADGKPKDAVSYQNFGGIAGYNGEDANIWECENTEIVFLERNALKPEYISNIGGIAGVNKGTLAASRYTAGTGQTEIVDAFTKECFTGAETGSLPMFTGINVGGIAGKNEETGKITACGSENLVLGYRNVGGVAGNNAGILIYQEAFPGKWYAVPEEERSIRGLVAASDCAAGGVVGTNSREDTTGILLLSKNPSLTGFKNYANVFANSLAGGITGANGGTGEYHFTANRADADYYDHLLNLTCTGTDGSLQMAFEVENKENMTIYGCENYGFVYAVERYSGGIAGVNLGSIESSNSMVSVEENTYLKAQAEAGTIEAMTSTDCVGGITGLNLGRITGNNVKYPEMEAAVTGLDFVGGIAGANRGIIEKIQKVSGNIWAKGYAAGGIAGLNMNADSMEKIAITEGMQIRGGYFAGGIIGLNVTRETENPQITGKVVKKDDAGKGSVSGIAYTGGILGYNTTLSDTMSIAQLFDTEIVPLAEKAFDAYVSNGGTVASDRSATVFKSCFNYADVTADRYLGGIVGYNGEDSPLYIIDSTNYGTIAVREAAAKREDGYYFIGGITGRNSSAGVIHGCINDGSVKSPSKYLGGICEVNEGYIQFCAVGKSKDYENAGITGENSVGGLVGLNSNYIVKCGISQYAKITGGDNTGGIAGTNDSNGVITGEGTKAKELEGILEISAEDKTSGNCVSSGSVQGQKYTGGIVGLNQGEIELVSVEEDAKISGTVYVGGLIGSNEGTITQSSDTKAESGSEDKVLQGLENHAGKVVGEDEVGGIVGKHNATKILNCKNYGNVQIVTGKAGNVGGITGSVAEGITVTNCKNYGIITGNANERIGYKTYYSHAGGITGENHGIISNCKNYGTAVSNEAQAGGIVGNNAGMLKDCGNYGSVQGAYISADEVAIGGIVGINTGSVKECASKSYEDNRITGVSTVGGIIGYNCGTLENTTADCLLTDITIYTANQMVLPSNYRQCRIGGIIGREKEKNSETCYEGYTYAGTICVTKEGASYNQSIGGIIGELEKNMVLKNCMLTGAIKGLGNGADDGANGGVGALAGVSRGTVIVSANADGRYTATTKDSIVEGKRNVGGIVGKSDTGHTLKIQKAGATEAVRLEYLAENTNADTADDIYYTNLATVSGGIRVGGCYGYLLHYAAAEEDGITLFNHYQNGYQAADGRFVGGNIKQNLAVTTKHQAVGGISGSNHMSDCFYQMSWLKNYGTIGSSSIAEYDDTRDMERVGGIAGNYGGIEGVTLEHVYNYGRISCGRNFIGGLVGRIDIYNDKNHSKTAISDCANYGVIETKGKYVGGLAGGAYRVNLDNSENRGAITVYGNTSQNIGGMIGAVLKPSGKGDDWVPVVSVTDCVNYGAIGVNQRTVLLIGTNAGGMVGNASGNLYLKRCTNEAEMNCINAGRIGGMLGFGGGSTLEITDCINRGAIEGQEATGGILGEVNYYWSNTFKRNENYGTLSAKYRSGGLIGKIWMTQVRSESWEVSDCRNYANIYPVLVGTVANKQIHEIGGCIGYMETQAIINRFENHGNLILDATKSTAKAPEKALDIGGIAGYIKGAKDEGHESADLYQCKNYGTIKIENPMQTIYSVEDIGGIAGCMEKAGALLQSCENLQNIDTSNYTGNNVADIGGIVGEMRTDTKLLYCLNQKSVITAAVKGKNVGGIAGNGSGLIYACRTENLEDEHQLVQGKEAVGGIVGYGSGLTCKLAGYISEDHTRLLLIQNTFDVTGMRMVGGIVGSQKGATIAGAVNCEGVTVSLQVPESNSSWDEYAAGGISGYAHYDSGRSGLIVNCYNFGQVRFVNHESQNWYLGGIVGVRKHTYEGQAGTAIKDSFYLHEPDTWNRIDTSRPSGSTTPAVLAVGNEPEGSYTSDREDQMYGLSSEEKLLTKERFLWTKDSYEKMYRLVNNNADPVDIEYWADCSTVMKNITERYDQYKLPVPETDGITSDENFNYHLTIKKMPGFCEEVELYLYDGSLSEQDIESGNAAPLLGPVTEKITMDGQLKDIAFSVETLKEEYIGKPIKAAIIAKGVTKELADGTKVVYSTDSDLSVVREFIIMPPLVTPEICMEGQEGAKITFRITNWENYQKAAKEIYGSIPEDIAAKEIYQKLLCGLLDFDIIDYYCAGATSVSTDIKDTWTLTPVDLEQNSWTLTRNYNVAESVALTITDGTFVIDYAQSATFKTYRSARQYHTWKVTAVASHTDWSVERAEVEAGDLYRYTTSLTGTCKFRIQAEVPLNPPTNLTAVYIGGMDVETEEMTPSYEISFERSSSPQEAISHYLITVTNPANGRTYATTYIPEPLPEEEEGSGTEEGTPEEPEETEETEEADTACRFTLSKDTLIGEGENQLAVDLEAGSEPQQLKFTVQTVKNDSDAALYFINSNPAEGTLALIKQGYPVEEPITISVENPSTPDIWLYQWNDNIYGTGNDTYIVTWKIVSGTHEVESHREEITGQRYYSVDVSGYSESNTIEFSVVRKGAQNGENVTRLHSKPVVYRKLIGAALADVENVTTAFERIDGENLIYTVDFTIPTELSAENCSGFAIKQVTNESPAVQLGEEIILSFDVARPIETAIPLSEGKGKNFYTIVTALSKLDESANAAGANGNTLTIPSEQLLAPENIKAGVAVKEEDGVTDRYVYELTEEAPEGTVYSFLMEEFADMTYHLNWTLSDAGNIKRQHLALLAPQENPEDTEEVIWELDTNSAKDSYDLQMDLMEYAGKDLTLKIQNLPDVNLLNLPSEIAEVTIHVPKIRLKEPVMAEEPLMIRKADNTPLTEEDVITAELYQQLRYQINWTAEELTEEQKETGVKIRLEQVEKNPETGEDATVTPIVNFQAIKADGTVFMADEEGNLVISWQDAFAKQEENPGLAGQISLSALPTELAGKTVRAYISHITGDFAAQTADESWCDSYESAVEFTIPTYVEELVTLSIMSEEVVIEKEAVVEMPRLEILYDKKFYKHMK